MLLPLEGPPSSATVFGVILNDQESVTQLQNEFDQVPYKAAPQAPILYIKPANTWVSSGANIMLPQGEQSVEVGATMGIVMGRDAARVTPETASDYISGYTLVADLSLPHVSYYRPAVREKCFDDSCVFGAFIPASSLSELSDVSLQITVDQVQKGSRTFTDLLRNVPQLLADISEFMTLRAGDILLVGVKFQAVQAMVGSRVQITGSQVGAIEFTLRAFDKEVQA
ncbi:fumarylacetoacetate hydrolase family protein [Alcaligenes endophyticus]|uniref:Fumarylacetoacetate hydrolase family protein n=1 Tax=Alcaligenes endophyticus TaxID=1929088 RepID=A0ABT8EMA7_9BURK|nr:fumarylacetoacetate hydrolase family protein [Alcaligenes endophyticus]MCX5591014.1 fumarylacetoacetate hydrolase family protein [Alcaligenes endophyticus]MDN4122409.1 fumarylacetoacetate hydrolase family protein [Alcaligenes endophyticus]